MTRRTHFENDKSERIVRTVRSSDILHFKNRKAAFLPPSEALRDCRVLSGELPGCVSTAVPLSQVSGDTLHAIWMRSTDSDVTCFCVGRSRVGQFDD